MKSPPDPDQFPSAPLGPPAKHEPPLPAAQPTENPRIWRRPDGTLETRIDENEAAK